MVLSLRLREMKLFGSFLFISIVTRSQGGIITVSRQARLSRADPAPYYFYNNIDGQPGTYSYGYDVQDPNTGNNQYRTEERYPNGTVIGSYGYIDAWGRPQRYKYIADERGYRVMRDPPYQLHHFTNISPINPVGPSSESSITWTRPNKPNKKKEEVNYVYRPINNFLGPPSSYAED